MTDNQTPAAPGWDAIDAALSPLYGARPPKHYGTLIPYRLGGPDPLHGISAYFNESPTPHWHYVTYGLTELWEKEGQNPDVSGFGFELTFRLAVAREEPEPPLWPMGLLQNLARYVFTTGRYFEAGHHFDLNGPIVTDEKTALCAVAFAQDARLEVTRSANGAFEFLQAVALHADELDLIRGWNTRGLLELLAKKDSLFITRLDRPSVLEDPALAQEIRERMEKEGSSTGALFSPVVTWTKDPWGGGFELTLAAVALANLDRLLHGRIRFGRGFIVEAGDAPSQRVRFEPAAAPGVALKEGLLTVSLTAEAAEELRQALPPKRGEYRAASLPDLKIQIVPTEVKDTQGAVVKVIG
jgi:hypothetical protein